MKKRNFFDSLLGEWLKCLATFAALGAVARICLFLGWGV